MALRLWPQPTSTFQLSPLALPAIRFEACVAYIVFVNEWTVVEGTSSLCRADGEEIGTAMDDEAVESSEERWESASTTLILQAFEQFRIKINGKQLIQSRGYFQTILHRLLFSSTQHIDQEYQLPVVLCKSHSTNRSSDKPLILCITLNRPSFLTRCRTPLLFSQAF